MIQIHTLLRYDNCDSEKLSDFLTVTFSVVDIFWLPRIFLYPGKLLALHFIHKTPMRTSKSYVNPYWQQIQEWEQNSSAVNNSWPHSQCPQLIGPRRTSGSIWAKGSLPKSLWISAEKVSLWWQGFDKFNSGAIGIMTSVVGV